MHGGIPEWFLVLFVVLATAPLWWPFVVAIAFWLLWRKERRGAACVVLGLGAAAYGAFIAWLTAGA